MTGVHATTTEDEESEPRASARAPRHIANLTPPLSAPRLLADGAGARDAVQGKGRQRRPQKRLDRQLEEAAKAVDTGRGEGEPDGQEHPKRSRAASSHCGLCGGTGWEGSGILLTGIQQRPAERHWLDGLVTATCDVSL